MRKWILLTLLGLAVAWFNVGFWTDAHAFFGGGDETNQECVGNSCNETKNSHNTKIVDKRHHNFYGGQDNIYGDGSGNEFSPVNNVTNKNKNTNKNTNVNLNKNDNTNIQGQLQGQGQAQGQLQGQAQGQAQGQTAHNEGVNQTVNVNDIDQQIIFNPIDVKVNKTDSEFKYQKDASYAKTQGNVDAKILSINHKASKKLGKDTVDYKIFEEMLWENNFQTAQIRKGAKGMYMGSLILVPTGDDCTKNGLSGRAYQAAMVKGATNYTLEYYDGLYMSGSKAGLDLGGAGSMVASQSKGAMIGAGSTLGYSHAWSLNEYRTSIVIDLYFDDTLEITKHKKVNDGFSKLNFVK